MLADSPYHSEEHEGHLIKLNAQEFLMRKAERAHPLSEEAQQTSGTLSQMVRVEDVYCMWSKSLQGERPPYSRKPCPLFVCGPQMWSGDDEC